MTADELIKHFEGVKQSVIGRVPDIIQTAGVRVQADAKRDVPVDTTKLRASITVKSDDNRFTSVVYTNTEYAAYVEFGTGNLVSVPNGVSASMFMGSGIRQVNMRPQPYLMPAFDRHAPKAVQAIDKLIKDSL